jgi:hypothetical protein
MPLGVGYSAAKVGAKAGKAMGKGLRSLLGSKPKKKKKTKKKGITRNQRKLVASQRKKEGILAQIGRR